ncbi:MAG: CinA family protein [Deltaproteobacteria bacterium]|nr:CinA family protein [Deltaproteobacteria bacterium]
MKNAGEKPEEAVGRILKKLGLTIGIAESCTGGLLCHRITSVPGSSDYFIGGVIAYNNDLKRHILNVPKEILQKFGAVSKKTAKAMAWGAKKRLGSNIGIAITGIAGPTGGSKAKPIGTVFIAISSETIEKDQRFLLKGSRQDIKLAASNEALKMLKEFLEQADHVGV